MFRCLVVFLSAALLSACAFGNKYDYSALSPQIAAKGEKSVAVVITDQRPYIANGGKPPSFIGLQRGGYGNPFDVTTSSGRPMVSDMADGLVKVLKKRGFDARRVEVQPGQPFSNGSSTDDRTLHIALREWKSDTFGRIKLIWNMEIRVLDMDGAELARLADQGEQAVGAGASETDKSRLTIAAANSKFAELLNKPEIRLALQ